MLVAFWASWCEPCAEELPALARLRAAHAAAGRPLEVLTVNLGEGPERAAAFLRERGVELPVLLDRDQRSARTWGAEVLPAAFLVGADGRVRHAVLGACDWATGEPGRALEALLHEASLGARRRPAAP